MTADCFHLNNDSGCLKGLKSRSVWRETERKGKGQRGWSRRKDGNKREEEEEEEMRRGEREEEEEEGNTKTTLTSAGWSYTRSIDSF